MKRDYDIPEEEYPYEPVADRWYRKHMLPLHIKSAYATKMYLELRFRGLVNEKERT